MNSNPFTRRQMLAGMSASALLGRLGSINAHAQSAGGAEDYKALVCVLLAGGNDGHNTIIPLTLTNSNTEADFNTYIKSRGVLALPDNNGPLLQVQTKNGTPYGLNPGLSHIHQLWATSGNTPARLAVLANAGNLVEPVTRAQYLDTLSAVPLPTNLFSHSDQMQQIQSGIPSGGGTGWGARAADVLQAMNGTSSFPAGVSLSGPSLFCTGKDILSTSLFPGFDCDMDGMNLFPPAAANARLSGLQQVLQFDSGLKLVQTANQSRKDAMALNALLIGSPAQVATPFPATPIGDQLKQVAKIIKIRAQTGMSRQIFFCKLGTFDTHYSQSWWHWNMLNDLSEALAAFYKATADDLQIPEKVTTFTMSDFGRTLQPSGNGCDHGWGNHHLILGGAVKGGDVYGTFPSLALGGDNDSGSRGALIPTTSLAQYGATLAKWFGVPDGAAMKSVFDNIENFQVKDLGFMS